MQAKLTRAELVAITERLLAADGTEEQLDDLLQSLAANVPHPAVSDLIYHPKVDGLSAAELVDQALRFQPILVSRQP